MDKKELAHIFIKEVDSLGGFGMVPSQSSAFHLAKSIPKDFEDHLVTTFYIYLLRQGGVFTNLKFVKEMHYPLLINAFRALIPDINTNKAGILNKEDVLFLFNSSDVGFEFISLDDFKTFLQVIIQSKKYSNVPGIASHQKSFSIYANEPKIVNRSIQTIENILSESNTNMLHGYRWLLFYSLVSIVLFDKSEKSISLIKYITSEKIKIIKKRTYIYCLFQIIEAHKNEAHVKPIINDILTIYPQAWLDEYVYQP